MIQQLGAQNGLRRRPLGLRLAGRSRCRTRRSPAPPNLRQVQGHHRQLVGRQQHVQRRVHDEGRHRRQRAGRVQGLHQQRRRLRGAARAPTTRCTTGRCYRDLLGGLFVVAPGQRRAASAPTAAPATGSRSITEDPSHPSTDAAGKPREVAVADELYQFDRKPRPYVHPLMLLNEATYVGAMGVSANAGNIEGGDHPIAWCSNYDGGREWSQVLGHNWELFTNTAVVPREHLPGHPDRGRA